LVVLGDPIGHSRSPAIHTAALEHLGIEGTYLARKAGIVELDSAFEDMRRGRLHGINVTMPLKLEAAARAELLTPEAAVGRSVNTVRLREGHVEGHSTDVTASRSALADPRFPGTAPILILGAGGAAAAALTGAAGRVVYIAARSRERASDLVQRVAVPAQVVPFGSAITGAVVLNATPIGMRGESLPEPMLEVAVGVIDLAYGQSPTRAIEWARLAGIPHLDGVEFLVRQAADSFRWWTGVEPPWEVMLEAARKA
jgi:shikimate dehydrogenase